MAIFDKAASKVTTLPAMGALDLLKSRPSGNQQA